MSHDFPATSIGRTVGNRLQPDAHPLLSPRPASSTSGASLNNNSVHPRYVPYTPRQRVTPSPTTTGTTVHPPSPQHQHGDATSKLQLMNLKAAAQMIGLDSGTLGWQMLEKLVLDAEEWTEVWNVTTSGRATLLLPLEPALTSERITPDFMKDHIILSDGPSRNNAPIVTLSGLRGTLEDESLIFRSTISTSSRFFQDLVISSTRTSALSRLPPLPSPFPDIPPVAYPNYHVTTHTSSLHFPSRSQSSSKPSLPPRPGARAHPPPIAAPRIGNPFASFFGSSAKPAPQPPPSPPTSLRSFDSQNESTPTVEVSAFAIDRRIVRRDIAKEVNKALRSELKAAIKSSTQTGSGSLPHWVTDRIHDFTTDWYPFVNARTVNANTDDSADTSTKCVVNSIDENLEDTSEHLQNFLASLEEDLRLAAGKKVGSESEVEAEANREHDKMEVETKIRETMGTIERLITWLFYDRLFSQPTTDDASHDEALSNRIAALNLLDLGLRHLGIDIGEVNEPDLMAVVKACGEMLCQLDSCRCPADKVAVLVAAHKIIVDGLARLPPVWLIPEHEANSQDGVTDVLSTAKPKPSSTTAALDNPEQAPISNPGSQAAMAYSPPEPISSPTADGTASPPTLESKIKPVPPPLDLDAPKLQVLPREEPTPVSGDVLFPLIIFSVVKTNPSHLVSNLRFIQLFWNQSIGGEESYCLINMMAVAEFLENVDMAALGLDNSKVLSTANLTPILPSRSPTTEIPLAPSDRAVSALRGRVEQQVDAIADSANKVISGVVDSSFGILRSFISTSAATPRSASSGGRRTPGTPGRTNFGLLKRESGFSIASLAASLPIAGRSKLGAGSSGSGEEAGQQMMSVSRPGSRSPKIIENDSGGGGEEEESMSSREESEEEENNVEPDAPTGDARRIRSFESMLSASRESRKGAAGHQQQQPRKALSDRLASMSVLATSSLKGSSPASSRRSSVHVSHQRSRSATSGVCSRPESPDVDSVGSTPRRLKLAPPKQRFMECTADDLKLSEIGELLRDYRRLADGVRAVGGFDE